MHEWTPEAQHRLKTYLESIRRALPADAGDPEEIISSLAEHLSIEAELHAANIVTPEHLERAIRIVGSPVEIAASAEPSRSPSAAQPKAPPVSEVAPTPISKWSGRWLILFGVVLPSIAVLVEFLTGMMAEFYMDPMPSFAWFAALCGVPSGFLYLYKILNHPTEPTLGQRWRAFAVSGMLSAFTTVYCLEYVPTIPLALLAILVFGLGFLGLSPHFAFLASVRTSVLLFARFPVNTTDGAKLRRAWIQGATLVLLLMVGDLVRTYTLERAMTWADSPVAAEQQQGYRALWWLAGRNYVLDRCYREGSHIPNIVANGMLGIGRRGAEGRWNATWIAEPRQAQSAFHLLTGDVFNQQAPPQRFSNRFEFFGIESWGGDRDEANRGGEQVGGRIAGLALAESRLDATLFCGDDGKSGESIAYLEWTMAFSNSTSLPQESRTLLHLPPGAVASRLTLWINGEEREAAFGERNQVRAAYQDVAVVRRQDPALLTTQGPDRVLLQCFPIPAGGTLKAKLGVTVPLLVRDGQAYLRLPDISERNHALAANGTHHLWVEAKAPLSSSFTALKTESSGGVHTLRGEVPLAQGDAPWFGWIAVPAETTARGFVATLSELQATLQISGVESVAPPAGPVWLVVDTSAAMRHAKIDWARFLEAFPAATEFHAIAGDIGKESLQTSDLGELADWLQGLSGQGGANPIPALEQAWEDASGVADSRLLWIHAPFPVARPATAGLEQILQRRPPVTAEGAPRFFDMQVLPGPNRALESLGAIQGLALAPIVNDLTESLCYFAKHGRVEDIARTYRLVTDPALDAPLDTTGAAPGSDHIVRLAVNATVQTRLASKRDEEIQAATKLAQRTRLVTPVTGAVVLERQEQYERHGLNPNDNQDAVARIPAIPEPEEWALIFVAALALCAVVAKQRRERRGGTSPECAR